jgi:hypothetical protein
MAGCLITGLWAWGRFDPAAFWFCLKRPRASQQRHPREAVMGGLPKISFTVTPAFLDPAQYCAEVPFHNDATWVLSG